MTSRLNLIFLIIFSTAALSPLSVTVEAAGRYSYCIHVASHKKKANAEKHVREFKARGFDGFYKKFDIPKKGVWYRVYIGCRDDRKEALSFARKQKAEGAIKVFFIHKHAKKHAKKQKKRYDKKHQRGTRIGIVDFHRILKESKATRNSQTNFVKDVEAKRALFNVKQQEILKIREKLKREEKGMSPSDLRKKADEFAGEVKKLRRLKMDLEDELKTKDMELTSKHLIEIKKVLKTFSERERYTLILDKQAVIAADASIDITGRIIELYNNPKQALRR